MKRSRRGRVVVPVFLTLFVVSPCLVMAAEPTATPDPAAAWLGEELPLPLSVKTPQDLALKAVAERQYLVFNLLARGKIAWDAGDFATAAAKWESLLRVPGIDPDLERVIKPLAAEARTRSGKGSALPVAPTADATALVVTPPQTGRRCSRHRPPTRCSRSSM